MYCITFLTLFIITELFNSFSLKKKVIERCYSPTFIIPKPWVFWLFLWSQFCHKYLIVTIKIHSHILLKTTALKREVKGSLFSFQKAKAVPARVITNEEHLNWVWLAQSCFVAKWDFTLCWLVWQGLSYSDVEDWLHVESELPTLPQ